MSFLTRLTAPFRDLPARDRLPFAEQRDAWGVTPIAYQIGRPQWPTANLTTYIDDGYGKSVVLYACVNYRAGAVASAPLAVVQDVGGGQTETKPNHPLRRLMRRPNPEMSEAEFLAFTSILMDTTGVAVIEKARSASGRVVQLWHLRSDWIKPVPRNQAMPDWEYRVPGHPPVTLSSRDVIVVTVGDAPKRGYTGLPPVAVALREIGIENAMTDYAKMFFDRGAVPQYAIRLAADKGDIGPEKAAAIKEAFSQAYGGWQNWVRPAILGGGVEEIVRIGLDFDEMAYPQLRNLTAAQICTAYGVPPQLIGTQVGMEHGTFENYEQARRTFYQDTAARLWTRLDGAFTRALLPEFEDDPSVSVEFDTSNVPALQQDVTPVWERVTKAYLAGFVKLDEARSEIGLLPVEGDIGEAFRQPAPNPFAMGGESERSLPAMTVREIPAQSNGHGLYPLPPERRASTAATSRKRYDALTEQFAPALVAFWRDQGERVIAAETRSADHGTVERRDVAELDWNDEQRELLTVLNRLYDAAGQTAIDDVAEQLGVDLAWDLANPNVHRVLSDLATRIVGISQTTRDDVARIVGAALDEGVDLPTLAARLRTLFAETYQGRALAVARTESMVAYNVASVLGYRESGVVEMAELADNSSHNTDPGSDGLTCAGRNHLIVPLDQVGRHIAAEHTNGSLAVLPVLNRPVGSP